MLAHGMHLPCVLLTTFVNTFEPGYNDIGLHNTPSVLSDILWYRLIPNY